MPETTMTRCGGCGAEVPARGRFCSACGGARRSAGLTALRSRRPAWIGPAVAVGVLVAIATAAWMLSLEGGGAELSPSALPPPRPAERRGPATASPSPVPLPATGAAPFASAQPARPVDRSALRRAEDLLAWGHYLEADQLVSELLGGDPSEPRLRDLQALVAAESQRAAEEALAQAQHARAQAGIAAGADLARAPFEAAKRREAEGARLAQAGRWAEARAEWVEAARLFEEAEDQAWVEGARQRYELARVKAAEAGLPRTLPDRLAEAQSAAARGQAAWERRDLAAAVREFDSAAEGLEAARAASLEAARRAAALEADRDAIAAVLAGYAAALEQKDLPRLKSLWPSLAEAQEAKVRDSFQFAQSLTVSLEALDVQVQGGTATAVCRRQDRIVTDEGQRIESDRRAVIRLRRGPDGWVIDAIH